MVTGELITACGVLEGHGVTAAQVLSGIMAVGLEIITYGETGSAIISGIEIVLTVRVDKNNRNSLPQWGVHPPQQPHHTRTHISTHQT